MDFVVNYILARAQEASTWAGVAVIVSHDFHLTFSSNFSTALISFLVAGAGLAAVLIKDKGSVTVAK
jgi:hypothetical protein